MAQQRSNWSYQYNRSAYFPKWKKALKCTGETIMGSKTLFSLMSIVLKVLRCAGRYSWMSHLASIVVYIKFAWIYAGFNLNDYYFKKMTQILRPQSYARKLQKSYLDPYHGNSSMDHSYHWSTDYTIVKVHWPDSGYCESCADIYSFFNIFSFTAHIQRFWTQITNSAVFTEIFISQKWVFLPNWFSMCQNLCNLALVICLLI